MPCAAPAYTPRCSAAYSLWPIAYSHGSVALVDDEVLRGVEEISTLSEQLRGSWQSFKAPAAALRGALRLRVAEGHEKLHRLPVLSKASLRSCGKRLQNGGKKVKHH